MSAPGFSGCRGEDIQPNPGAETLCPLESGSAWALGCLLGGGDVGTGPYPTRSKGAGEPALFWEECAAWRGRESPDAAAEIGHGPFSQRTLALGFCYITQFGVWEPANCEDKIGGSYMGLSAFYAASTDFKKERDYFCSF